MASYDVESTSSSDDELDHLRPRSLELKSVVPIIDIESRDGQRSQNLEPAAIRIASNSRKVVLNEKIDISKLQSPSMEKSVLKSQKSIVDVFDQISNGKMEPQTTGAASPTSYVEMSDEMKGRYTNMQDAECQTVLTGELPAGLEKVQHVGSQTISTGDVISLNVFHGDMCNSDSKLHDSTCDPLNDRLYNCIALKDIENHINILQDPYNFEKKFKYLEALWH